MSRTGGEGRSKKRNCCLTCSIVCFVIFVIFIAALYIGGSIMFKTYVSPHIGGLELNDALALAGNVLSGKEAKTTYAEEDLDSFYSGLSSAMFLSDKSEDELEYELVPKTTKESLAPETGDDAKDDDADFDAFRLKTKSDRYALLADDTKAKLSLEEYSALAGTSDASVAARNKVGLKTYRLSVDAILGGMEFGAEDFSYEKALEKSLSSLEFNFGTLEEYDIHNELAAQNEKFTTFSVNGKQASAFINDIISYFLASENSPLTSSLKETIVRDIPLEEYVKVASVTIMNTPLATSQGEAMYDQKNTALGIAISIKLRDIVKAALETEELKAQLESVPAFAVNIIPSLVPKFFSANLTVFPLAEESDGREIIVTVNKPSEKNAKRLSILMNALLGDGDEDSSKTFFGTLNDKISSAFTSINKTVKINFIPSKDSEGNDLKDEKGNTYSEMKIMTWETVLNLIDKEGRLSAHDMLTMLKCLYISKDPHAVLDTATSKAGFHGEMTEKYGVKGEYFNDHNILSSDDLSLMADYVDLKTVDLKEDYSDAENYTGVMRVRLSSKALAAFMTDYVSGKKSSEEESTAAAEEESSSSSMLDGLELEVSNVEIKKVSDKDGVQIYYFEIGILTDIKNMLEDKLPTDGIAGSLTKKILPTDKTYFCIKLYIAEYVDAEDEKLKHSVGAAIDNPAEGETSKYLSEIRINDFSYDDTTLVFDALDSFMSVMASSSFKVSDLTAKIEEAVSGVFDSLAKNDYNLELRLYEEDGGGMTLPSLYEVLKSVVKPKLEAAETFSEKDAHDVLVQVYQTEVDTEKAYGDEQADAFTDEINDKYYIKHESALTITDLFGKNEDGSSKASGLANNIKAQSIYFKYDEAEAALWQAEKKYLYGDSRSASDLSIHLSGSDVAALVEKSDMIPADLAKDFGTLDVIGASFETITDPEDSLLKTYLNFDLKLVKKEGGDMKFAGAMPQTIKLTARILLNIPGLTKEEYPGYEPRFSTKVKINETSSSKTFLLLRAVGGDDLSEEKIADKIKSSIESTFNSLEKEIPIYYAKNDGNPYKETVAGKEEQCIRIADVFSFLIKETTMTDTNGETTDPDALANRLRAFGKQTVEDTANEADYSWIADKMRFFVDTDDDYVYTNMQQAYFMIEKPNMTDVSDGFSGKFDSINGSNFNLKNDEYGLFYYDGDVLNLRVSDRALGVIVNEKYGDTITKSIENNGESNGLTATIKSLKIYHEGDGEDKKLVIESGILITFDGRADYAMMPNYFFIIATTVKCDVSVNPKGYVTTISLNRLEKDATVDPTAELFFNIDALSTKGVKTNSLNKANIENQINDAIATALNKFPETVTYDKFTSDDITDQYNETNYPDDSIRVAEGDGYVSFPSVYSYIIDKFYTEDKPTEKEMQHMLVSLHAADATTAVITNPKDDGEPATAYYETGYRDGTAASVVKIISDKRLAREISDSFKTEKINGDITLSNGIDQTIILRAGLTAAKWGDWVEKFFADPATSSYNAAHNYIIATVTVDFPNTYSSGSGAELLPEKLCFTVLADMSDSSLSKGLLYNMDHSDMEIFEHIIQKENPAGGGRDEFSIDGIAEDLAGKITEKLDGFAKIGIADATITYRVFTLADDFVYSADCDPNYDPTEHAFDHAADGFGYLILSLSPIE